MGDSSTLKTNPEQDLLQHGMSSNAVLITLSLLLLWGGRISYIFVEEGLKELDLQFRMNQNLSAIYLTLPCGN